MKYLEDHIKSPFKESIIVSIILLVTFICLSPTLHNQWVNWDDPAYVLRNKLIHELNWSSVQTIFKTPVVVGLYHPLTLISLSIDFNFWGNDPFGFHLSNLIFHLLNTLLVYVVFRKLKSSILVSVLVSLIFGMHPMHVESVAWISGRKDVMYVFFYLLTLISYMSMVKSEQRLKRILLYFFSITMFVCSILSKNIAFTLPLILLLIDYLQNRKVNTRSIAAKTPFFIVSIIAIYIAKYGQQASDSMQDLTGISYGDSIINGVYNTSFYIFKLIVPIKLAAFHPFPTNIPTLYYLAILPFLGLIYFSYWSYKNSRKLFFGLLFFLITIGPLLQIIPFGKAVNSERYTYLAYIGLFYFLAVLLENSIIKFKNSGSIVLTSITLLWVLLLGFKTNEQSRKWQNSNTLWSQVIDLYPDSDWALMSRGLYFAEQKDYKPAIEDFNKSISINPTSQALYERGRIYEIHGFNQEAVNDYEHSIAIDSNYYKSYLNIGVLLSKQGDQKTAIPYFQKAIQANPEYDLAYFNYATSLKLIGELEEAIHQYDKAIKINPNNKRYITARGVLHTYMGHWQNSISDLTLVLNDGNKSGELFYYRSISYTELNQQDLAQKDRQKAIELGYSIPN